MGQHRLGRGSGPAHGRQKGVWADDAADHDRIRCKDGQDRRRCRLADGIQTAGVRLLAVLAQHRRRRCRTFPAPVHGFPAGGDRTP